MSDSLTKSHKHKFSTFELGKSHLVLILKEISKTLIFLGLDLNFNSFNHSMRLESCSCLAGKGLFKNLDVGDEGLLTAGFEKIDNGFDFGPHASAWENS